MNATEAVRLINENVSYKAGWDVSAYTFGDPGVSNRVYVSVRATLPDSDRRHAPNYVYPITSAAAGHIDVSPATTEQSLYKMVLELLIEQEIHEAREFFKVGRDFYAPFHPHTNDGKARWDGEQLDMPKAIERASMRFTA